MSDIQRWDYEPNRAGGALRLVPTKGGSWMLADDALARIRELEARVAELEGVVKRLPRTADGVPVVPGDKGYWLADHGLRDGEVLELTCASLSNHDGLADWDYGWTYSLRHDEHRIYSTRDAALAARNPK